MLKIFMQVLPGTWELALDEFKDKADLLGIAYEVMPVSSDFEILLGEKDLALILPHLKIPNRVLIRIEEFKARDFPKLYNKISKLNWKKWIAEVPEKIHVTSHESRLIHSDRIEESVRDGIKRAFQMSPVKAELQKKWKMCSSELFIRVQNDVVTISTDAAGEMLAKRGYRALIGTAPLRENRSALLIYAILKDLFKVGSDIHLFDPMMGTGSLLVEALLWYWPNHYRNYYWPNWNQIPLPQNQLRQNQFSLVGSDIDPKMVEIARQTFESLQEKAGKLKLDCQDVFIQKDETKDFHVISNPPYDIRINVSNDFHQRLIEKNKFQNAYYLLPSDVWRNFKGHRLILAFSNSGIDVELRRL